jgi:Bax protein
MALVKIDIELLRGMLRGITYLFSALLPLALAVWLVRVAPMPGPGAAPRPVAMTTIAVPNVAVLEALFEQQGYAWPPQAPVPAIALGAIPGDIEALDPATRKAAFLRMLLPLVLAENQLLRAERRFLVDSFAKGALDAAVEPGRSVATLARRYRVAGDLDDPGLREVLLRRVDELPVALVLAQAALESGWGTSRFAREANNLFGIWTWESEGGVVPERRRAGMRHRVRAYDDLRASVHGYMRNLNVGHAYIELRKQRAALRAAGRPLDAVVLAQSLSAYSERGMEYVDEITVMIEANDLVLLEGAALQTARY